MKTLNWRENPLFNALKTKASVSSVSYRYFLLHLHGHVSCVLHKRNKYISRYQWTWSRSIAYYCWIHNNIQFHWNTEGSIQLFTTRVFLVLYFTVFRNNVCPLDAKSVSKINIYFNFFFAYQNKSPFKIHTHHTWKMFVWMESGVKISP